MIITHISMLQFEIGKVFGFTVLVFSFYDIIFLNLGLSIVHIRCNNAICQVQADMKKAAVDCFPWFLAS